MSKSAFLLWYSINGHILSSINGHILSEKAKIKVRQYVSLSIRETWQLCYGISRAQDSQELWDLKHRDS